MSSEFDRVMTIEASRNWVRKLGTLGQRRKKSSINPVRGWVSREQKEGSSRKPMKRLA